MKCGIFGMKNHPPKYVSPASLCRSETPTRVSPTPSGQEHTAPRSLLSAPWLDFDFDGGEAQEKEDPSEVRIGSSSDDDRFMQSQALGGSENATVEFGTAEFEETAFNDEGSVGKEEVRQEGTCDSEMRQSLSTDWTQQQGSNTQTCSPIKASPLSEPLLSTILSRESSSGEEEEDAMKIIDELECELEQDGSDGNREEIVLRLLRLTQTTSDSHEVVKAVLTAIARTGGLQGSEEVEKLMEKVKNAIEGAADLERLWEKAFKVVTAAPVVVSMELPFVGHALLPILSEGHRLSALHVPRGEGESLETRRYSPEIEEKKNENFWEKIQHGSEEEIIDVVKELAGEKERGEKEKEIEEVVDAVGVLAVLKAILTVARSASLRHEIAGIAELLSAIPLPEKGVIIEAPVAGYPKVVERELERFLPWFAPTELEGKEESFGEKRWKKRVTKTLGCGRKKPSLSDPLASCEDEDIKSSCKAAVKKVIHVASCVKRGDDHVMGLGRLADILKERRTALISYVEIVAKKQGELRDTRQIPYPFVVLDLLSEPSYRGPRMALPRAACSVAMELVKSTGPLAAGLMMKRLLPSLVGFPAIIAAPVITEIACMGSASGVWQGMVAEKAGVEMMVRVGSSIIDEVPSVRSWFRCHVVNALGVPPKIRKMAQKILDGEQAPTPKKGPPSGSVGEEGGVALLPIVTAAKPSSGACELKKEMEELRKSYEELYEEYVKVCGLLEKSNRAQLEHAAERARTEKELLRWRRSGNVMMASRNSAVVGVVERMMMVLEEGSLVEIAQCYAKVSVARSGGEKGPTREELKMIFLAMFRKACEIRATELLGYALGVAVGGDFLETVTVSEVQEILRCALRGMEFAPREEGLRSLLVQVCSEVPQEVLKEGWRRLEATLKFGGKGEVEERVRELLSRLSGA